MLIFWKLKLTIHTFPHSTPSHCTVPGLHKIAILTLSMQLTVSPTKTAPGELPSLSTHENTVILDHRPLLHSCTARSFSALRSEGNGWTELCENVSRALDCKEVVWSAVDIEEESERGRWFCFLR